MTPFGGRRRSDARRHSLGVINLHSDDDGESEEDVEFVDDGECRAEVGPTDTNSDSEDSNDENDENRARPDLAPRKVRVDSDSDISVLLLDGEDTETELEDLDAGATAVTPPRGHTATTAAHRPSPRPVSPVNGPSPASALSELSPVASAAPRSVKSSTCVVAWTQYRGLSC
jgi:hypothetical protein